MVTHDAHAAAIADRILFLADGLIVKDLGPSNAARDPRSPPGGDRPMIGVALKGLLGRKLRATLTAFAIVLGVAMISGAFVLTDTLGKSFDGIYADSYKATDAVISSKVGDQDRRRRHRSAGVLGRRADARSRACPASASRRASIEDEARLVDKQGKAIGKRGRRRSRSASTPSADQSLNPLQLVKGQWPSGDGQIAIDKSTAEKQHFAVGQTVGAFGDGPLAKYEVSGIVRFGSDDSLGGTTISVFDLATAQQLFDKRRQVRPDPRRRRRTASRTPS